MLIPSRDLLFPSHSCSAFRNNASVLPLTLRRHRFEEVFAESFLEHPRVNYAIDFFLERIDQFLQQRAVSVHAGKGMTYEESLQFVFGTHDRGVAGAIGWEVEDIKYVLRTPLASSKGAAADEDSSDTTMSKPNLREKMTLLYMQPCNRFDMRSFNYCMVLMH